MIDPQIPLSAQPIHIETPLEAQYQQQTLSNLGNQGELQRLAITGADQENQQRQLDLNDQNLFRQAYANAGGDIDKVTPEAVKLGVSLKGISGWNAALLAQKTAYSKLNESDLKNTESRNNIIGGGLAEVAKIADPVAQKQAWDSQMAKWVQDKTIPAAEPYPGSGEAVQHFVNLHKTSDQLIKEITANAAQTRAGAAAQTSNREQLLADVQRASVALSQAPNADAYTAAYDQLPAGVVRAGKFPSPETWTADTPKSVLQLGMKPAEISTADQAATNATNTQTYRTAELADRAKQLSISMAHLGIDRLRLQNELAGNDPLGSLDAGGRLIAQQLSTGDFNPGQLGRFKDKEKIIAAGIQLAASRGLNWTPQMYDTKKAFGDPSSLGSKNLATIARIAGHVGRFETNSAALGTLGSLSFGFGSNVTGTQKATAEDAHAISAEMEKLNSGGVGTAEQTRDWSKMLRSPSVKVRQQAVDEIAQLVGSQYEAMNQQYRSAVGTDLPLDKYVSPVGRAWLKKNNINVTGAAGAGAAPPPAGTPAPQPTAGGQTLTLPAAGAPGAPGGQPAPQPAAVAPPGSITVVDPNGTPHYFLNRAQADAFKKLARIP
jgi:hypothetical protein